ncbi:MAG: putative HAD-hydrolase [Methanocella sp. PtaU1.Bin125]|nr:MAG: putative HAD-hydrolase [Methanocella sp. PtaU1.Bin125]
MIDTVTFDVWNTLVVHEFYDDRLKLHRISSIMEALRAEGYVITGEQMDAAYDYTEASLAAVWKSERDVGNDTHLALFLEGLGLDVSDALIDAIREPYSHALLHFRPKLVDGAAELLVGLKRQGYRIGLISNTGRTPGRTMRKVLDGYGLTKCFDAMTFSDEVCYIKPNPRIFALALDSLRAKPESTVHVGDNPLLDVYGARACGIGAILFTKYMDRFEQYASKYYSANGRQCEPDCRVDALPLVEKALARLAGRHLPGSPEK